MLDIKFIRENTDLVKEAIKKSGVRWVNSSKDYWKIISGTELIFKGVPKKNKLDHGVQDEKKFDD